jgi:phosphatidylethanolamine-binding protein (PEBP) family uncharacterized protein
MPLPLACMGYSSRTIIQEDSVGIQGRNSMGTNKYIGPCPPSGIHQYHFKVYALDIKLIHFSTPTKKIDGSNGTYYQENF